MEIPKTNEAKQNNNVAFKGIYFSLINYTPSFTDSYSFFLTASLMVELCSITFQCFLHILHKFHF